MGSKFIFKKLLKEKNCSVNPNKTSFSGGDQNVCHLCESQGPHGLPHRGLFLQEPGKWEEAAGALGQGLWVCAHGVSVGEWGLPWRLGVCSVGSVPDTL